MKKLSKQIYFTLAFVSFAFAMIPTTHVKAASIPFFAVGACGPTDMHYWSPETYVASSGDYYMYNALENLFIYPIDTPNGDYENLQPVLATNWTFQDRPDGMTDKGFMAYDGIEYMDITLREGVKFHDGSDWNATVCKWNIDRLMCITGNINGLRTSFDSNIWGQTLIYWIDPAYWGECATATWNTSEVTTRYYPGFGTAYDAIVYSREYIPRFFDVTVLENKASGGTLRVYFNDWGSGPSYLAGLEIISKAAYEDFFNTPIIGYGENPAFPQDDPETFPGHLIGTGPYVFVNHDETSGSGTMTRFDDWWNASAQQAEGWHMLENVGLTQFAHTTEGYTTRTTALTTGDIQYATDRVWEPIDYSTVAAIGDVNYEEMGVEGYGEQIILNCIDETYFKYWADIGLNVSALQLPAVLSNGTNDGDIAVYIDAGGVDRAFRKALSYAYDYETYLDVGKAGRAVRSGGLLGVEHEYYDDSIPLAYHDLDIARETLLNDPVWGPICSSAPRNLDSDSTDAEWEAVATSNPIFTFDHHYDGAHEPSYNTLVSSLASIGCAITATVDTPSTYSQAARTQIDMFSIDGFAISPYHAITNDLGYIQAYLESKYTIQREPLGAPGYGEITDYLLSEFYLTYGTTYPLVASTNMGFSYNKTCDDLIQKLWFQNSTGEEALYHELADWCQNFQYPALYLSNEKFGYAISNDWETEWNTNFFPFHYNYVKYSPAGAPEPIPGYEMTILITVGLLTFAGIAFTILRKRKQAIL